MLERPWRSGGFMSLNAGCGVCSYSVSVSDWASSLRCFILSKWKWCGPCLLSKTKASVFIDLPGFHWAASSSGLCEEGGCRGGGPGGGEGVLCGQPALALPCRQPHGGLPCRGEWFAQYQYLCFQHLWLKIMTSYQTNLPLSVSWASPVLTPCDTALSWPSSITIY